jgi:hypothetical protein
MSKNIYRVNKKSDVDIIFKNNLLKPIFLIFVDNKTDTKLVDEIEKTLLVLSKKNTYGVSLLINFDKFTDEMNFFNQYKENTPSFVSFFLGQQITEYSNENSSNFISIIVSIIEKIHSNYVNKLNTLLTADTDPSPNTSPNTCPNTYPSPDTSPNTYPSTNTMNEEPLLPIINSDSISGISGISGSGGQGGNNNHEGSDNDTDEIRLKKEKLKLLLKQKELLEIHKSN